MAEPTYRCTTSSMPHARWAIVERDAVSVTLRLVALGGDWNAGYAVRKTATVSLTRFERDWKSWDAK
jgi:hypothetical protein